MQECVFPTFMYAYMCFPEDIKIDHEIQSKQGAANLTLPHGKQTVNGCSSCGEEMIK